MRYLAWPWQAALASQEMFANSSCHRRRCAKLRAERCPSHTGPTLCCTPPATPALCFLFCESHFDCHMFAFISFPAPYMTHPRQDGGARADGAGLLGSSFPHFPACSGQLFGRQSHGEEPFSRLQELTCHARGSWAQPCFAGQAHQGYPLPMPWYKTEVLLPL